jgi:hypothetical protein
MLSEHLAFPPGIGLVPPEIIAVVVLGLNFLAPETGDRMQ